MEKFQGKLVKISDDASSRKFYRLKNKKKTSIIVKAKKEKFKNLIVYSAINKFLKKNKILAPQLLKRFFKHGVIEIDDFGFATSLEKIEKHLNSLAINQSIKD